jgi:hypothetical protein
MPAKKGSIDYTLRKEILDEMSYIGRNFLSYLPVVNGINLRNKMKRADSEEICTANQISNRGMLGIGYLLGSVLWLQSGLGNGAWTPSQMMEYSRKEKEKVLIEMENRKKVDKEYHNLYINCKDLEDSVRVALDNGFPIEFKEPADSLKEKAVNQNRLEGKL